MTLGLSRREYAAKIGMHHNTYMRKVQHLRLPRKPSSQKPGAALDFVAAASEFIQLRPKYLTALKRELRDAKKAVVDAKARVVEIQRLVARFERAGQ